MVIKVSTLVQKDVWEELKDLSKESHQNISRLVTEALREFIQRKRVRPDVVRHMEDSINENEKLGKLLAK